MSDGPAVLEGWASMGMGMDRESQVSKVWW